jgi:hypothetical protein
MPVDMVGCVKELRSRIEALEAAQRPPHQDKLDRLMALDSDDGEPIVLPSSRADLLIDRVAQAIYAAPNNAEGWRSEARAAIREVAAWLRSEYPRRDGYGTAWANLIEQEANR